MAERLISKEATKKVEWGGVIAGLIGLVTGLRVLDIGFVAAGGAAVYDIYQARKEKKTGAAHTIYQATQRNQALAA